MNRAELENAIAGEMPRFRFWPYREEDPPRKRRVVIRNNRLVSEKPQRRKELERDARID